MTLIANGHREPMTKSMALDLAFVYEATGRTVQRSKWVTVLTDEEAEAMAAATDSSIENLFR